MHAEEELVSNHFVSLQYCYKGYPRYTGNLADMHLGFVVFQLLTS